MNISLITLWLIVLLSAVAFVYLSYKTTERVLAPKDLVTLAANRSCTDTVKNLTDISSLPCCVVGGLTTSSRYAPAFDMVVSPVSTYYMNVCKGFCPSGFRDGKCLNSNFGEETAFNLCIDMLMPKDCIGAAVPIAKVGDRFYYGRTATRDGCEVTGPCAVV